MDREVCQESVGSQRIGHDWITNTFTFFSPRPAWGIKLAIFGIGPNSINSNQCGGPLPPRWLCRNKVETSSLRSEMETKKEGIKRVRVAYPGPRKWYNPNAHKHWKQS